MWRWWVTAAVCVYADIEAFRTNFFQSEAKSPFFLQHGIGMEFGWGCPSENGLSVATSKGRADQTHSMRMAARGGRVEKIWVLSDHTACVMAVTITKAMALVCTSIFKSPEAVGQYLVSLWCWDQIMPNCEIDRWTLNSSTISIYRYAVLRPSWTPVVVERLCTMSSLNEVYWLAGHAKKDWWTTENRLSQLTRICMYKQQEATLRNRGMDKLVGYGSVELQP